MSVHIETPTFESVPLSKQFGLDIALKMEAFQPSGSFKMRGIGALMRGLMQGERPVSHFFSSSGGNAGFSTAVVGRQLGCAVTVFVPTSTKAHVIDAIKGQGADVVITGAAWDDTHAAMLAAVGDTPGAAFVHPFDDPRIWAGHATMVAELRRQSTAVPDAIVLSVGGGGLLCGVLEGLHAQDDAWARVPVVCVETHGAASFAAALAAGQLVTLDKIATVATTLGARRVCQRALSWSFEHRCVSALVSDDDAIEGAKLIAAAHRVLVEPACGAAVAALPQVRKLVGDHVKRVLVIVCGGVGGRADFNFS